ncbi:unnamed protein product [Ixodes pacificus]
MPSTQTTSSEPVVGHFSLAPYPSRLPNCPNRHPRHHRLVERRSLQGRQRRKGAKGQNTLQEVRSLILGSYRTPRYHVCVCVRCDPSLTQSLLRVFPLHNAYVKQTVMDMIRLQTAAMV